jgi:tetratricopeptide (TPR) repeat protein
MRSLSSKLRANPPLSASLRVTVIQAVALVALVLIAYIPAMYSGFVWDDKAFTQAVQITSSSLKGLKDIWLNPSTLEGEGHYWPLAYTTFWLQHLLWGLNPAPYHCANILLHALAVVLVWRLLRRLAVPGAWIAATLFAVHPIHVESVAWVISRKDLLSAVFCLTAFLCYERFHRTGARARYGISLLFFVAAMLSKSIAVSFPVAILLWLWWKNGRLALRDLLPLAPFLFVAAAMAILDVRFLYSRYPTSFGYSLVDRGLIAGRAICFYAVRIFWPGHQTIIYPLWKIDASSPAQYLYPALVGVVLLVLWRYRGRWGKGPLVAALGFCVTLGPTLGLVDSSYMKFSFVADRYQYLASIWLLALLSAAIVTGCRVLPRVPLRLAQACLTVAIVALAALTWQRAIVYKDEVTLFSHIAGLNPNAADVHLNLGAALLEAGRPAEAIQPLKEALTRDPGSLRVQTNLGCALARAGRPAEAIEHLEAAAQSEPNSPSAQKNLGNALRDTGRLDAAAARYEQALRIDGNDGQAHFLLGDVLVRLGRFQSAENHLRRAVQLEPGNERAYERLGVVLFNRDNLDEAAKCFKKALDLKPDYVDALQNMGHVSLKQKDFDAAAQWYERALKANPALSAIHSNLAAIYIMQGRPEKAIEHCRAALRINPNETSAKTNLNVALKMLGQKS